MFIGSAPQTHSRFGNQKIFEGHVTEDFRARRTMSKPAAETPRYFQSRGSSQTGIDLAKNVRRPF
jgi:hypothetical protein